MPHAWRSELSSLSCPLRHTGVARTHGNAKSGARGGENRTQHGKFDCIPIPHHHADLPPIFWPSCREQTRPKILCRCCSWSCAVLPQMAERGAGRRRRPEIVHALRISPLNYRPGLPFIAEPPPPSVPAAFVVFICGLAVHPGWCDLRPGFAADANLKGEMRQHYAMISGWTRSLSSR